MNVRFEVEAALQIAGEGYVFARLIDDNADFELAGDSMLGGYAIERWLDMPRAVQPDGSLRSDLFSFRLKSPEDLPHFRKGTSVVLSTQDDHSPDAA